MVSRTGRRWFRGKGCPCMLSSMSLKLAIHFGLVEDPDGDKRPEWLRRGWNAAVGPE